VEGVQSDTTALRLHIYLKRTPPVKAAFIAFSVKECIIKEEKLNKKGK
jgi:hypothetical protein